MPKATIIKKSKFIKDESGSINLFDVSDNIPMAHNRNSFSGSKQETRYDDEEEERNRTQGISCKSECHSSNHEKDRKRIADKRTGDKENLQYGLGEGFAADGKGDENKGIAEDAVGRRSKSGKRKETGVGIVKTVKKSKRNVENLSGREDKIDLSAFEFSEFSESATIMPMRKIQCGPYPTDSDLEVFIVINDICYRVSECSIKDGYYIQGLDSRFLVSKFKPSIK